MSLLHVVEDLLKDDSVRVNAPGRLVGTARGSMCFHGFLSFSETHGDNSHFVERGESFDDRNNLNYQFNLSFPETLMPRRDFEALAERHGRIQRIMLVHSIPGNYSEINFTEGRQRRAERKRKKKRERMKKNSTLSL